jgi:ribosome-associated toxin RatA of RatAB toxin-antitoxin module
VAKSVKTIVFDAPPDKCYEIVWDFAKYPVFVKELKNVEMLSREKGKVRAEFTIKVIKEIKYTLDIVGKTPTDINWTLVHGFFKKNDGGWHFEDLGKGRTEATYTVDVDFGLLVPPAVVRMLQESNLPKMLEAFKKRIEIHAKKV